VFVDFVKEKSGYPFGSDGFLGGTENHPLCKPVVDHDQQGVKSGGEGKVGDKIARDLLEEGGGDGFNRGERRVSQVGIHFALLAQETSFYVFTNKLHKARPPILSSDKLAGIKITGVLCLILVGTGVASRRKVLDKGQGGQGSLEGLGIKAVRFFEGRGIKDYGSKSSRRLQETRQRL
jgi:hypothetical protein